jgi:acyl carrier protein
MTLEEMIEICPDLVKITQNHIISALHKIGYNKNIDFNKSWDDNGLDILDGVELIMQLEKDLNINISDDVADGFFNLEPSILIQWVRNNKIDSLGI